MTLPSLWPKFRIGIFLFAVAVATLINGLNRCEDKLLSELASPSGKHRVVLLGELCDGNEGFTTTVSFFSTDQSRSTRPHRLLILGLNTAGSPAKAGPGGGPQVQAIWRTDHDLILTYSRNARVMKQVNQLEEINVSFEVTE